MRFYVFVWAILVAGSMGSAVGQDQEDVPTLNDGEVYFAVWSDHEVENRSREDAVEFDFEAIYIVSTKMSDESPENALEGSIRVSPLGGCRHPAWTKQGDRLAYVDFSSGFESSKIVIIDFKNKKRVTLNTTPPAPVGLAWNAAGDALAYCGRDAGICVYNLTANEETVVFKNPECEDISYSPDGKSIAFLTRDGKDGNDADGRRLNLLNLASGERHVVGDVDDGFGVHGPFMWTEDSRQLAVLRSQHDEEGQWQYIRFVFDLAKKKYLSFDSLSKRVVLQTVRFWKHPLDPN